MESRALQSQTSCRLRNKGLVSLGPSRAGGKEQPVPQSIELLCPTLPRSAAHTFSSAFTMSFHPLVVASFFQLKGDGSVLSRVAATYSMPFLGTPHQALRDLREEWCLTFILDFSCRQRAKPGPLHMLAAAFIPLWREVSHRRGVMRSGHPATELGELLDVGIGTALCLDQAVQVLSTAICFVRGRMKSKRRRFQLFDLLDYVVSPWDQPRGRGRVNPEQSQHIYCKGLLFFFFFLEISPLTLIKFFQKQQMHKALERERVRVPVCGCWMGFLQVFLHLMKICLAIPIEIGWSQASGGLLPHCMAPRSHTRARWWEQVRVAFCY